MSRFDGLTNIELAEKMVSEIEIFEGDDAQEIATTWDRSDMIWELNHALGEQE